MVGVTSIYVKESLDELAERLRQAKGPRDKERLQVLYWLKQDNAPSISAIAKAVGKHRNTLQTWLSMYRDGGLEAMLETKKSPGGVRVIPQWAEDALAKRLKQSNGFASYGAVQQWLAETLGVEAHYHAVYQMTRYRLKAKLKVVRPQNYKQDSQQRAAFKQTSQTTAPC
ncbi:helix-turn-helix domain-containing protein [Microcoleus sp. FACHB-68]|uniref:helix-turn-helix domain-containing protein n=1 Tax=Microcoleus sp. FACHB-68 TaxID=2692826 RepID=UPI0016868B80|nr:helix-turn-helix domain-containing protein [Microcoleus sp. FACHB-68]MBD1939181.1 helix-turn-helix domain-containing protein [Microcoleus sp. FACHB-68]